MSLQHYLVACAAGVFSFATANAMPVTVDYGDGPFNTIDFAGPLDAFVAPSISRSGVTATGSGDLVALEFNGLGVDDVSVNANEYVDFVFDDGPASSVFYEITFTLNGDGDGVGGERLIEAWDENDVSLGVLSEASITFTDLTSLFAGAIISRFRLTADGPDGFRLETLAYETAVSEVPVPAALPLFLAGLAGIGAARRRRKA